MNEPGPNHAANRDRRDRRARQRDNLRLQILQLTGERNRARQDRDTLTAWITNNVPGITVRGRSGQRTVEATIHEQQEAA